MTASHLLTPLLAQELKWKKKSKLLHAGHTKGERSDDARGCVDEFSMRQYSCASMLDYEEKEEAGCSISSINRRGPVSPSSGAYLYLHWLVSSHSPN